jgi:hypothetical protein
VAPTEYSCKYSDDREGKVKIGFRWTKVYIPFDLISDTNTDPSQGSLPAHSGLAHVDTSLTAGNTGSEACIGFVLSQFRRCQATHTECGKIRQSRRKTNSFVPTRVLDVGHCEASTICLIKSEDCVETIPYIALSHCWGGSQTFKLTRTTAARLRAGILLTNLPKTFQDAIHVARKMQIQYLWIDSLYVALDQLMCVCVSHAL